MTISFSNSHGKVRFSCISHEGTCIDDHACMSLSVAYLRSCIGVLLQSESCYYLVGVLVKLSVMQSVMYMVNTP